MLQRVAFLYSELSYMSSILLDWLGCFHFKWRYKHDLSIHNSEWGLPNSNLVNKESIYSFLPNLNQQINEFTSHLITGKSLAYWQKKMLYGFSCF